MKKIINFVWIVISIIIGIPILLIASIAYLFFVPFDIIRYHRMPYYKDFKNKYQFFITSRDVAKIYNRTVREHLPIEYIKNNSSEAEGIWKINIFGKSVEQLVSDGINSKLSQIGEESQSKLQDTMQKIVNDSNGGMVCIII